MNEKQMLFAYDRRRTSTLTVDEQPGAHTGATRKYIPGYSDANIVFLNTSTGNDGNTGASIAQALLTYSAAATAASTTKKIRLVNSATLSTNITKPTEATIGTTSTIASSLTAPVDTWTQAGTPSFGGDPVYALTFSPKLSKFVAVGDGGKIAYSSDGNIWTQASSPSFGASVVRCVCWSDELGLLVAGGSDGKIAYSVDAITWTQTPFSDFGENAVNAIIWAPNISKFIAVGSSGFVGVSPDGQYWTIGSSGITDTIEILALAYSKELDLFVLCGAGGNIYYSTDGYVFNDAQTPSFGASSVTSVTWSAELSKFVAVGDGGKIAYSSDGNIWTQAGTPSFGGSGVSGVTWMVELSKFVAVGNDGKIAYSSDGNIWTQAGTPSFGADQATAICYSVLVGKCISAGEAGKIAYSTAFASTISASVAGFTIQAMQYSGIVTAYNCSLRQPGTTAALSLENCRVEYDSHISNNAATSRATLYRGDRHLTCTPAAQNAIDLNLDTWGGAFYIYNASQTGFERIRDCLGAGPIVANYPVTVNGRANIEGSLVNVLTGAEVSFNDVSFVDTTDYKLEFQTNGYARNSFAVGRSNLYFNSAGDARDIGAWSYVESAVSYYFAKSAVIYKGEIQHGLEFQLNEQQGDSGVVSVYGNTRRVKEVIVITYGTVYGNEKEIFEYMLTLTDKTVKIQIDPEWDSNPGSVVVNGNQSAGSEFLTVDSTAYYEGMWLTIAGKRYWVMRAAPSPSAATKLILDRSLEDAVTDNDVITRNYPAGAGEYQFSGPTGLTLKRVDPTTLRGYYTGFQIRLVRKKQ